MSARNAAQAKARRYTAQFSCLAEMVAAADAMVKRFVATCRCPYCSELLIVPERPALFMLPGPEEERHG
jgi:hypothetical protein